MCDHKRGCYHNNMYFMILCRLIDTTPHTCDYKAIMISIFVPICLVLDGLRLSCTGVVLSQWLPSRLWTLGCFVTSSSTVGANMLVSTSSAIRTRPSVPTVTHWGDPCSSWSCLRQTMLGSCWPNGKLGWLQEQKCTLSTCMVYCPA